MVSVCDRNISSHWTFFPYLCDEWREDHCRKWTSWVQENVSWFFQLRFQLSELIQEEFSPKKAYDFVCLHRRICILSRLFQRQWSHPHNLQFSSCPWYIGVFCRSCVCSWFLLVSFFDLFSSCIFLLDELRYVFHEHSWCRLWWSLQRRRGGLCDTSWFVRICVQGIDHQASSLRLLAWVLDWSKWCLFECVCIACFCMIFLEHMFHHTIFLFECSDWVPGILLLVLLQVDLRYPVVSVSFEWVHGFHFDLVHLIVSVSFFHIKILTKKLSEREERIIRMYL